MDVYRRLDGEEDSIGLQIIFQCDIVSGGDLVLPSLKLLSAAIAQHIRENK